MQEDYEIIVIVSLFIITDFFVKIPPRMQEIAFLSLNLKTSLKTVEMRATVHAGYIALRNLQILH
jgi:hypothetical protein